MQNVIDYSGMVSYGAGGTGASSAVWITAGTNVRGIIMLSGYIYARALVGTTASCEIRYSGGGYAVLENRIQLGKDAEIRCDLRNPIFIPAGNGIEYANANATDFSVRGWFKIL